MNETPPPDTLLDVRGLSLSLGDRKLVNRISFHIKRGEMLALVGESGCGKSLTASAVMQLLPSAIKDSEGEILFGGMDLAKAGPRAMRDVRGKRMSLILQEPMTSLNPVLRIGTQIAEVLRRHEGMSWKDARRRAVELLDRVGIPDPGRRAEEYPHNFSGGMRQRVMIAIAVACSPKLLIADEPTTALDVSIQAQIMELIDQLRRDLSMGILLITHDLGVVAQWADRIAVMYAGRLVEESPTVPFFSGPHHPYSRGLLRSLVGQDEHLHYTTQKLSEIPGTVASAASQRGCPFLPRCERGDSECAAAFPPATWFEEGRYAACFHAIGKS
jgi:peptide/nickel transport system ATP-binding protein